MSKKYFFPTSNKENTLYQHIMRNYTIPAFLWQQLINWWRCSLWASDDKQPARWSAWYPALPEMIRMRNDKNIFSLTKSTWKRKSSMSSWSMANSAPNWRTLALTTTYIQTGNRVSMDQVTPSLLSVMALNMSPTTASFWTGVKVVLSCCSVWIADKKCRSLCLGPSSIRNWLSTSRNVRSIASGCLFHRKILSQ